MYGVDETSIVLMTLHSSNSSMTLTLILVGIAPCILSLKFILLYDRYYRKKSNASILEDTKAAIRKLYKEESTRRMTEGLIENKIRLVFMTVLDKILFIVSLWLCVT